MELSRAFQTALCVLVSNTTIMQRFAAGELEITDLHDELTETDITGLLSLLNAQRERVIAVAEILTSRRRLRVRACLPATVRMLGERFENYWAQYLRGDAARGSCPGYIEAAALATRILRRLGRQSIEYDVVNYELCRNDIAGQLRRNSADEAVTRSQPRLEHCRLRLSGCARIERFTWAVDETMRCFRQTGEVAVEATRHEPVSLVFYPIPGRRTGVGVTKVSRAVDLALQGSETSVDMDQLLGSLPTARRPRMLAVLDRLVSLRALDVIGAHHALPG